MAWVTEDFIKKWETGEFVGADTPTCVVQIQEGKWIRGWNPWTGPRIRAQLWNEPKGGPPGDGGFWQSSWEAHTDWVNLPNLLTVELSKDLGQQGITVATVTLDAVDFEAATGDEGDPYHVIRPGANAPYRGFVAVGRPDPGWDTNDVGTTMVDGVKIRIWQGLGTSELDEDGNPPDDGGTFGSWTFSGQIDDIDPDAGDSTGGTPNQIVITARNGKMLTDQYLFGATKSKQIPDPITFQDDNVADIKALVGYQPKADDHENDHPSSNVLDRAINPWDPSDPAYSTTWRGPAADDASDFQWIQIKLPQGLYEDFFLVLPGGNHYKVWIGMKLTRIIYRQAFTSFELDGSTPTPPNFEQSEPPRIDSIDQPTGWVPGPSVGLPDPANDFPYFKHISSLGGSPINVVSLGHNFAVGKGTILRIALSNLPTIDGNFRAEVADLHARRRRMDNDAANSKLILVPDVSDCVRVLLRWCGFRKWEVEESGVRLNGKLAFDRTKTPMDAIQTIAQQLGFIFFLADPTGANSDGIPTFRRDSSMLADNKYIAIRLRDDRNLTGCKPKHSDENRVFIIRVRGTSAPASADIPGSNVKLPYGGGFVGLGGDTIKRIMAVYNPPWAFGFAPAGIMRRVIYHDDNINSYSQCVMGCFLIALQSALLIHTVQVAAPAHPILELDDQITVLDEASGTNSRVWVTNVDTVMNLGDQQTTGSEGEITWTMTASGSMMDSSEFHAVIGDILATDWKHLAEQTGPGAPPLPSPITTGISRLPRTR